MKRVLLLPSNERSFLEVEMISLALTIFLKLVDHIQIKILRKTLENTLLNIKRKIWDPAMPKMRMEALGDRCFSRENEVCGL